MTVFGLDVSHYQAPGLDLNGDHLKGQGYEFVAVKATEGTSYNDPAYHEYRDEAQRAGMLFAAYHFLAHGNITEQVDRFCEFVADPSIPIMLDVEAYGANLADAEAFRAEAVKRGRRVTLLYLPEWYWLKIGRPALHGWNVVSSAYPSSAHEFGSALYPGAKGSGWVMYGGVTPTVWQFASHGKIDGYAGDVDLDAYEGTREALAASGLFKDYAQAAAPAKPAPVPEPVPVPVKPAPVPAPVKHAGPTRVQDFRKGSPRLNLRLLDRAVAVGRTGRVRDVRNRIAFQVRQLPHDQGDTRVNEVRTEFAKSRVVRLDLLAAAVKAGRVGRVKAVHDRIVALVASLPAR